MREDELEAECAGRQLEKEAGGVLATADRGDLAELREFLERLLDRIK